MVMLDGAFSPETDPGYNPPEPFVERFTDTGIVVNARIVGDVEIVTGEAKQLLKPGMKLIIVTYCKTPEEQENVYRKLHAFFG